MWKELGFAICAHVARVLTGKTCSFFVHQHVFLCAIMRINPKEHAACYRVYTKISHSYFYLEVLSTIPSGDFHPMDDLPIQPFPIQRDPKESC